MPRKGSCPCLYVKPCHYACTCANPVMSGGCTRCCSYGSLEQRKRAARRLAAQIDTAVGVLGTCAGCENGPACGASGCYYRPPKQQSEFKKRLMATGRVLNLDTKGRRRPPGAPDSDQ